MEIRLSSFFSFDWPLETRPLLASTIGTPLGSAGSLSFPSGSKTDRFRLFCLENLDLEPFAIKQIAGTVKTNKRKASGGSLGSGPVSAGQWQEKQKNSRTPISFEDIIVNDIQNMCTHERS